MKLKRSEAEVKASVMKLLEGRGILFFRMQSGAMFGSYKGRTWKVALNPPGTADILAFVDSPALFAVAGEKIPMPVWIELKRDGGKQSPDQKFFEQLVTAHGHKYVVVHSAGEFLEWLKENRAI